MRGGVTVNDLLYNYSFEEREAAYAVIKENIEATKESKIALL